MVKKRWHILLSSMLFLFVATSGKLFTQVTALFSSTDKPGRYLAYLIDKAKHTIHAAVYTITDAKIAQKLVAAKERHVDVQIITDQTCLDYQSNVIPTLNKHQVDVFIFPSSKRKRNKTRFSTHLMHHKFAIIDDDVWTGSFNWTKSAQYRNKENVIICNDQTIRQRYETEFEQLKKECFLQNPKNRRSNQKSHSGKNSSYLARIKENLHYLFGKITQRNQVRK